MSARRSFVVSRTEAGQTVAAVLRGRLKLSFDDIRRLIKAGCVRVAGKPCFDFNRRAAAGQSLHVQPKVSPKPKPKPIKEKPSFEPRPGHSQNDPLDPLAVVFVDDQVVIVDKPPGLTTMRHAEEAAEHGARGKKYLPTTLADMLPPLLPGKRQRVRPVHRLDKDTSGLVVFARTVEAEGHLGKQFRAHTVERRYLALVRGQAVEGRIESSFVRDRGDGRRGTGSGEGQRAVTDVRVMERIGEFTLVECRLETGRTHQVRIHLGEAGTPLCGERLYDRPVHGRPLPDGSGAKRAMLHATSLGFTHPETGQRVSWTSPLPEDMESLLDRLRSQTTRA